jgi:IS5 family transposase
MTYGVITYTDHHRRAKRKLYKINNARRSELRHPHYLELIRVTRKTVEYAENVLQLLGRYSAADWDTQLILDWCASELKTYIPLGKNVIDQAYRRIVEKESVPASEKIFSIFEPHTDIISKGAREAVFGHKISVVTGESCLVLQLSVLDGNPKDSTLVKDIFDDHKRLYGTTPTDAAFDGCFASKENRDTAKKDGVSNITFSKNLSMPLESLLDNPKKHKSLLNFRAGIEGCIAVAYNLTLLARFNLRAAVT